LDPSAGNDTHRRNARVMGRGSGRTQSARLALRREDRRDLRLADYAGLWPYPPRELTDRQPRGFLIDVGHRAAVVERPVDVHLNRELNACPDGDHCVCSTFAGTSRTVSTRLPYNQTSCTADPGSNVTVVTMESSGTPSRSDVSILWLAGSIVTRVVIRFSLRLGFRDPSLDGSRQLCRQQSVAGHS